MCDVGCQKVVVRCRVPVIVGKSGVRYICKILLGLRFQQNVFLCLPLFLLNLCVRSGARPKEKPRPKKPGLFFVRRDDPDWNRDDPPAASGMRYLTAINF